MIRKYPCNREYEKVIRYNGSWFKLRSIFDDDAGLGDFDFNQQLIDGDQFDFNAVLDANKEKEDLEREDNIENNIDDAVLDNPLQDDTDDFYFLN